MGRRVRVMVWGKGIPLRQLPGSMWIKEVGELKLLLDNLAPRKPSVQGKGVSLAGIQSNPVVKSTGSGEFKS